MVYTNYEVHDMMEVLFESRSYKAAETNWRQRHPDRFPHSRKVFSRLSRRIKNEGIIQPHHNKGKKIRCHVVRSADILASTVVSPHDSLRRRERDSGISKFTINIILQNAKFHPYRMQLHQHLIPPDFQDRLQFCNWALGQPGDFHRSVLWSDECTFKSDAEVNTWNCRYWSQHVWKVNVRCGILDDQIIGPIFLEQNLNSFRYVRF